MTLKNVSLASKSNKKKNLKPTVPVKLHFSGDNAGIAVDLKLIQQICVRLCYGISHPENNINIINFLVHFYIFFLQSVIKI
jgi:hypothetical protein